MALRRLKIATWVSILGLCLSMAAFGVSILNYFTAKERYAASNTLSNLDKRLNPEITSAMRHIAACLRDDVPCDPMRDLETQQAFFVFFGYLDSVAFCVQLDLCSDKIARSALAAEIDAAKHFQGWIADARQRFGDSDYLLATEEVLLSR
ncbi:MAG: hypothetical protein AAF479_02120 [Pseudomonadota bacterium]